MMEATTLFCGDNCNHIGPHRYRPINTTVALQPEWACGWCKGFVHEEWQDGMRRYVHDETPVTKHEVLPFRPGR